MNSSCFAVFIGLPGSVRIAASTWSRTASWSCSGIPSSMLITRIGIWAPRSATKSNRPAPISGSRLSAQNSRIFGSSACIFLGVKTRETSPRCTVCSGGSSKMKTPDGNGMFALISSRIPPRPEM